MVEKVMIDKLLNLVKEETIPAIGCTEPIAVAYAGAIVSKYLDEEIEKLHINVSKNIYKNGKFAVVPNTGQSGLDLAGLLGVIAGDYNGGLMVLKNINEEQINLANKMIKENKVILNYLNQSPDVYVELTAIGKNKKVEVTLMYNHDYIDNIKVNDEEVYKGTLNNNNTSTEFLNKLTIKDLREISEVIPIKELEFIQDGISLNLEAAEKGLSQEIGLNLGTALKRLERIGKITIDGSTRARLMTAAAADMRMGGAVCPIMTSGGSGNQGIGVILPIVVVAEEHSIDRERLLRAVFFGHVINKYVKVFTGKLSYMCGCAIAAGIGASAGISWMLGGNDEQINGACSNMLANLTGMLCDGAKESCSLKLSTSAGEAVLAAYLANEDIIVKPSMGIIGKDIDDTIKNIGLLCKDESLDMDSVILKIMK